MFKCKKCGVDLGWGAKFRVQTWWGDERDGEWSYGTVCATEQEAMRLASDLETEGWTVRIVQE